MKISETKIINIFLLGIAILIGAILLNIFASFVGFLNWYDFLKEPGRANLSSYIWLFILYPLGLGFVAYFVAKVLKVKNK